MTASGAKLSDEAKASGVKVCYGGCELGHHLCEIASTTAFGSAYLTGKLALPGAQPVPTPQPPAQAKEDIGSRLTPLEHIDH